MQSPERFSQQPAKETHSSGLKRWWEIVSTPAISYFNKVTSPEYFVEHDPIEYLLFIKSRSNAIAKLRGWILDARCEFLQFRIQGKYGHEDHKYSLESLDKTGRDDLMEKVSDLIIGVDNICPILVSYRLRGRIDCQQFHIPGRYDVLDELNN